jgi:hypothetical protein
MLNWQGAGRHERRIQEVLNLIFQKHSTFLAFLFDQEEPRLRQEPEWLLAEAEAFSTGEKILIRIALDLWDGSGQVDLWDIVERLDEENYHNVLAGLRHLRPIQEDGAPMVWRQPKMAYLIGERCSKSSSS